jgi:hypothetical protein
MFAAEGNGVVLALNDFDDSKLDTETAATAKWQLLLAFVAGALIATTMAHVHRADPQASSADLSWDVLPRWPSTAAGEREKKLLHEAKTALAEATEEAASLRHELLQANTEKSSKALQTSMGPRGFDLAEWRDTCVAGWEQRLPGWLVGYNISTEKAAASSNRSMAEAELHTCSSMKQLAGPGSWEKVTRLCPGQAGKTCIDRSSHTCNNGPSVTCMPTGDLMVYKPRLCRLPLCIDDVLRQGSGKANLNSLGHTRFVGDSVTGQFYRSFRAYTKNNGPRNKCFSAMNQLRRLLEAGGHEKTAVKGVLEYMFPGDTNIDSQHVDISGCDSPVSSIRLDSFPWRKDASSAYSKSSILEMAEVLVTLCLEMSPRLTSHDTLVLNVGVHYIGAPAYANPKDMHQGLAMFLRKWSALAKSRGDMPRLVWRDTSPQHFASSPSGEYHQPGAPDGDPEHYPCRDISEQQVSSLLSDSNSYINDHRRAFVQAVQCAGLVVDGFNIAVLPVWRATIARRDEHTSWGRDFDPVTSVWSGNIHDCTHFCERSSVLVYWNAALANLIRWMQEGQRKVQFCQALLYSTPPGKDSGLCGLEI